MNLSMLVIDIDNNSHDVFLILTAGCFSQNNIPEMSYNDIIIIIALDYMYDVDTISIMIL